MLRTEIPPFSPEDLEHRLQARLNRQALLSQGAQGDGPRYHAILDEAALRRSVGGPEVMSAQLQQLARSAHAANVTVQIIPFEPASKARACGHGALLPRQAADGLAVVAA